MRLQVMSDLHLEMHADGGAELIRDLDPTGVDVLVLAGDITMARHYEDLESVFKPLARKYQHILYVPGNHEYYKSSPKQVTADFEPWVYDQNIAFEKALATQVEAGDVVVSHHLPAPESVPPRFARSAMNAFFVSDMTSYVRELQPKLWIHGHTHDRCDYVVGKTRVVANPLGYPNEFRSLEAFEPGFHVEI